MRKPIVGLAVLAVLVLVIVGFLFARAPQPGVEIKADPIFSILGFQVTNTIITAYVVSAILAILAFIATRKAALVPSGFYNFVEAIVEWMMSIVDEIAGERNGRRFFNVTGTIFLFIIACNYFGLLPIVNSIGNMHHPGGDEAVAAGQHGTLYVATGGSSFKIIQPSAAEVTTDTDVNTNSPDAAKLVEFRPYFRSVNTDANSPLAIALFSFVMVEWWGLRSLGFKYLGKFFAFPPFARGASPIGIFVGILELLSEFIRIVSFTFRLFGNIFAGDVLILFMSFLVPFIAPTVFYGMETFVGFIQAAVFALLTLVFAIMAVESHDEGEHEAHGAHGVQAEVATH